MKYFSLFVLCSFVCVSFAMDAVEEGKIAIVGRMPWSKDFKVDCNGRNVVAVNKNFDRCIALKENENARVLSVHPDGPVDVTLEDSSTIKNASFCRNVEKVFAIAKDGKNVCLWNALSGKKEVNFNLDTVSEDATDKICSVVFSVSGATFFVGTKNGKLLITRRNTSIERDLTRLHKVPEKFPIKTLILSNDGINIAVPYNEQIFIFSLFEQAYKEKNCSITISPDKIAFANDGTSLLVASNRDGVASVSFNPSNYCSLSYLKSNKADGVKSFFSKLFYPLRKFSLQSLEASPNDGKKFFMAFKDGLIKVCDSVTGDNLTSFEARGSSDYPLGKFLRWATFNKDGSLIMSTNGVVLEVWKDGSEYIEKELKKAVNDCTTKEVKQMSAQAHRSKMLASLYPPYWSEESQLMALFVGGIAATAGAISATNSLASTALD